MFWTPMEFPMTLEYSPWNYQCPQQGVHEYKMQWTKAIIDLQISKKEFHKKKNGTWNIEGIHPVCLIYVHIHM